MNDDELTATWSALEPTAQQQSRMRAQVLAWLEASDTSLWVEWLSLVRIHPVQSLGLAVAAAVVLVFATPLGAVPLQLLR